LFDKSKALLGDYIASNADAIHERFEFGMLHYDTGDIAGAISEWDRVLEAEPNYPPVLFHKAMTLLESAREKEAVALLETLVSRCHPQNKYVEQAKKILHDVYSQMGRQKSTTNEDDSSMFAPTPYTDPSTNH
jgi:tetratricopeptide (TPR) repeat protein